MGRALRVGVVGTSWWVELEHLPGLASRGDAEVTALCGRNPERLAAVALRHGVREVFTDWREMIRRADLEVLLIATPNLLHHPIALAALEAGLHVMCEKPLALDLAQAREMAARARAAARETLTFFTYRAVGAAAAVKRLVGEGFLGTPFRASAFYLKDSHLRPERPLTWRMRRAEAGTGVLADLGSHLVDLLRFFVGEFVQVCGQWQTPMPERPGGRADADEDCAFLAELEGGAQALVHASKIVAGRGNYQRVELCGREGTLVYEADPGGGGPSFAGRVLCARPGRPELVPLALPADLAAGLEGEEQAGRLLAYRRLTDPFFAALAGQGGGGHPDFQDGAAVQSVLEAVASSAERGGWVRI